MLEVSSVDIVDPAIISDRDARRSGFTTAAELVGELRGDPGLPTYRIEFRLVDEPDPREVLARQTRLSPDEVAEIDNRLERLDRASRRGSWTRQVLDMIADHPARRAGDLAEMVGRETKPFKTDVRKLKNLGLTISLETGYRLSPRGAAYLDARI